MVITHAPGPSPAEQLLAEQWETAELAATHAAFGVNRYLGDADFEIQPIPQTVKP